MPTILPFSQKGEVTRSDGVVSQAEISNVRDPSPTKVGPPLLEAWEDS